MGKKVVCPICKKTQGLQGFNFHLRHHHKKKLDEKGYEHWKKKAERVKEEEEEGKTEEVGTKKERYDIKSSKSIRLRGEDLHLAERLVNAGLAENLTDLMRKALKLYGGMNFPNILMKGGINEKLMEKMLESEGGFNLEKALAFSVIQNQRGQGNQGSLDLPSLMLMMRNRNQGSNDNLLKYMLITQNMNQGNNMSQVSQILPFLVARGGNSKDIEALRKEIRRMKESQSSNKMDPLLMAQLMNREEGISVKDILELVQVMKSQGMSTEDVLNLVQENRKMTEKYRTELDKKDRELLQERYKKQLGRVMKELEEVKESNKGAGELLEQVENLRKLAEKLGIVEKSEQSTVDKIKEIAKVFQPTTEKLAQGFMQSQRRRGMTPRQKRRVKRIARESKGSGRPERPKKPEVPEEIEAEEAQWGS